MAPVGQIVMQATQRPLLRDRAVDRQGRSISSSPRKKNDPASRLKISECLPVQPRPAFSAMAARDRRGIDKRSKIERSTLFLNLHPVFQAIT